jgi:leader peptidase (prepilin peptidase)/N-methyltransferase
MAGVALRPDHYDPGPALLTAAFALVFVVLSSTDIERRLLPNALTYPAIVAGAAFCWAWPDRSVGDIAVGAGVAAAIAVVLVLLGELARVALGVRQAAFGIGDAKLILLIGLLLGWPAVFPALFLGVIAAGVFSFAIIFRGRGKSVFSYGPFLILGASVALLWPERFV